MHLKGDDALGFKGFVLAVDHLRAVDENPDMLALGFDPEIIPVAILDQLFSFFLRISFQNPAATFFVKKAPVAIGHVSLRAGNGSIVGTCAAELDTTVAVTKFDLRLQNKITLGFGRTKKLILLELSIGPAHDSPIFD